MKQHPWTMDRSKVSRDKDKSFLVRVDREVPYPAGDIDWQQDPTIQIARRHMRKLVANSRRKSGLHSCAHFLLVTHLVANNKRLMNELDGRGIARSVAYRVAYDHDTGEDFGIPASKLAQDLWPNDQQFMAFGVGVLDYLNDGPDLDYLIGKRGSPSPDTEDEAYTIARLGEQPWVGNALNGLDGLMYTTVRWADKTAGILEDIHQVKGLLNKPWKKVNKDKIQKMLARAKRRKDNVVLKLEKLGKDERDFYLKAYNDLQSSTENLLNKHSRASRLSMSVSNQLRNISTTTVKLTRSVANLVL